MLLTIILIYIKKTAMYVCVCKAVTEDEVHAAIESGARSLRHLQQQLGVATQCGACSDCARSILGACNDAKSTVGTRVIQLSVTA